MGNLNLEKPPFLATPVGHRLDPNAPISNSIATVRTATNRYYGVSGNVRDGGQRIHNGMDETNGGGSVKFTGKYEGKVIEAIKASDSPRLGGIVVVEFKSPSGDTWRQKTMHMKDLNVGKDQRITPETIIGFGEGAGSIFKEAGAGPAHVHSEFQRNGRAVDPSSGLELPFNAKSESKRAEKDLEDAERALRKP